MEIQNVINRKSLEKQLKLVQTRIDSLQNELTELDKIRQACLVLMGSEPAQEPVEASKKETKSKTETDEEKPVAEIAVAAIEDTPALTN